MTTTLTLDKAGRVVLPKQVRDEMQLSPGDSLELEVSEGRIILRPTGARIGLHKKQGVWVFYTGQSITHAQMERVRRSIYRERENRLIGRLAKPKAKKGTVKLRSTTEN